jgi:hypothetical protein
MDHNSDLVSNWLLEQSSEVEESYIFNFLNSYFLVRLNWEIAS